MEESTEQHKGNLGDRKGKQNPSNHYITLKNIPEAWIKQWRRTNYENGERLFPPCIKPTGSEEQDVVQEILHFMRVHRLWTRSRIMKTMKKTTHMYAPHGLKKSNVVCKSDYENYPKRAYDRKRRSKERAEKLPTHKAK